MFLWIIYSSILLHSHMPSFSYKFKFQNWPETRTNSLKVLRLKMKISSALICRKKSYLKWISPCRECFARNTRSFAMFHGNNGTMARFPLFNSNRNVSLSKVWRVRFTTQTNILMSLKTPTYGWLHVNSWMKP